ncbi:MAG: nucleoside diphosphate kinase regulator [Xanthomonadales bacterium]|nr:nucleoside diphosphate kinase regulator [Xanthomonadales bacterium]
MSDRPAITLSSLDLDRIEALLANAPPSPARDALQGELERANIVSPKDVPADIVTMNSTVRLCDVSSDTEMTVTLVYPRDAGHEGVVSVLAPVGSALLGLAVGQEIDWPIPGGKTKNLRVLAISEQPEARGEFHR